MDIKDFRAKVDAAFAQRGLERTRLVPKQPPVWALPGEVVRFFAPHALRRPWGFELNGVIGLEIPELREWLKQHKDEKQMGIFRSCFAAFYSTNEPDMWFSVGPDELVPGASWAEIITDRLSVLPNTIQDALNAYERHDDRLGLLEREHHAWAFLRKWHDRPSTSLEVPQRLPNGRIA